MKSCSSAERKMDMEKTIHDVKVPAGVDAKQVRIAKDYVTSRLAEGFTMSDMFQRHGISSKTYYQWLDKPEYVAYINDMADVLIPQDELTAVKKMKKKIMAYADKANVSTSEMKIFSETFSYVFEADARLQAEKLGLNKGTAVTSGDTHMSPEEKKAVLFQKLKAGVQ